MRIINYPNGIARLAGRANAPPLLLYGHVDVVTAAHQAWTHPPFEGLSYQVFGACIDVQRQLGAHCLEVDYQRALEPALAKRGLEYIPEAEIPITYDSVEVTRRRADFVIWDAECTVVLEIKAARGVKLEDFEACILARGGPVFVANDEAHHTPGEECECKRGIPRPPEGMVPAGDFGARHLVEGHPAQFSGIRCAICDINSHYRPIADRCALASLAEGPGSRDRSLRVS